MDVCHKMYVINTFPLEGASFVLPELQCWKKCSSQYEDVGWYSETRLSTERSHYGSCFLFFTMKDSFSE